MNECYEETRLSQIWSKARGISLGAADLSNLDCFIVPSDENERNLIQRIGFVLSAKRAYDYQFDHPASHSFDHWVRSQNGVEGKAAQIIQAYVVEKDGNPRTMMSYLHSDAQRELVQKLFGVYPAPLSNPD